MASNPSHRPTPKPKGEMPSKRQLHRLPEGAIASNELAVIKEREQVDYDAALAWLNGEGPDPYGLRRAPLERGMLGVVQALKARVQGGRLKLDEPTDLPEGAEVDVAVIGDDLSPEERVELHASLDRALEDSEAGRGIDAWEFLAKYRVGRVGRSPR